MTVTFWAPDAPTELVTVPGLNGEPPEQETRSVLPTLNLGNANAKAFLALMGLPDEAYGELAVRDFGSFIERALHLTNIRHSRSSAVRPAEDRQDTRINMLGTVPRIEKGPRTVDFGLHDHQLERYVCTFHELLIQARRGGYVVCWG